jgi:hypothetical protein
MHDIASPATLQPLTRRLAHMVDAALAQAAARTPDPAAAAVLAAQSGFVPAAAPLTGRAILAAPAFGAIAVLRTAAPYAVAPVAAPARAGLDRLV